MHNEFFYFSILFFGIYVSIQISSQKLDVTSRIFESLTEIIVLSYYVVGNH